MPTDEGPEPSDLEVRLLDPDRHDRAGFDCGVERLNNFLRLSAKKQQAQDLTRVYVVVRAGEARVLGFHAVALGSLNVAAMERPPKATPPHGEVPVLFLSHVAVDRRAQGVGLGRILLVHALGKARVVADQAGCHAVLLDAVADGGPEAEARRRAWYEGFGFRAFASTPGRMFVTMRDVRALLDAEG